MLKRSVPDFCTIRTVAHDTGIQIASGGSPKADQPSGPYLGLLGRVDLPSKRPWNGGLIWNDLGGET
jgi:hypothetical protein